MIFAVHIPVLPEKESSFTPRYSRPVVAVTKMDGDANNGDYEDINGTAGSKPQPLQQPQEPISP